MLYLWALSSPHTWGCFQHERHRTRTRRVFPTHVGCTNKVPFLTVGDFLFSVPGSSHWADQLHDERAEAAGRSSHASKDGQPPGAFVLRGFKRGDTDIQCCEAFSMILKLGDHDVVEALVRARDLGLEPGKLGLHFPDLADKPDVLFFAHRAASIPLNRSPHPPEPGTGCARRPEYGASGPASRAKPSPSPPEQGLAGETVPHTNGSPSAEPATQG